MAQLNSNTPYLTMNGTNVQPKFVEMKVGQSNSLVDVTHGSATFMQRNSGLSDGNFSLKLGYDIPTVSTYITLLLPGTTVTIEYGPEGNGAGKPRHKQDFIVGKVDGPNETVKKDYVVFDISGDCADAPAFNIYAGATF